MMLGDIDNARLDLRQAYEQASREDLLGTAMSAKRYLDTLPVE
jgi:hypothetical protein